MDAWLALEAAVGELAPEALGDEPPADPGALAAAEEVLGPFPADHRAWLLARDGAPARGPFDGHELLSVARLYLVTCALGHLAKGVFVGDDQAGGSLVLDEAGVA